MLVGSSLPSTAHCSCLQEHPYPSQFQGNGPWRCWATQQVSNTSFKGWSTQIWKHHWEMHSCRKCVSFIHWCTMPSSFYPLHFLSTNLSLLTPHLKNLFIQWAGNLESSSLLLTGKTYMTEGPYANNIIKNFYSKFLLWISDCQIQSLSHCEDILWSIRGTSLK